MSRRAHAAFAIALAASGAASALACNYVLGIDVAPLVPTDAGNAGEGGAPIGDRCMVDSDCVAPNGCYVPRCDTASNACVYELCPVEGSCSVGECDTSSFTCIAPRPYGFRTTSFPVPAATSGCGASPDDCLAAAYPFVFVGTRTEVIALRVDDLLATSAREVPIDGLDFVPGRLVLSGRRLWVVGTLQGSAPPYQLPVAWLDVPSNPLTPRLRAERSTFTYPRAAVTAFPAPGGRLFVVHDDAVAGFPTVLLTPPLPPAAVLGSKDDAGALAMIATPGTDGSVVAGASGERLVTFTPPGTFRIVDAPGSARATLGAPLTLLPTPTMLAAPRFDVGPGGGLLLVAPVQANQAGDCSCITEQRAQWVLEGGSSASTTAGRLVTAETYANPPAGACLQCAYFPVTGHVAWTDGATALVAAPAGGDPGGRTLTAVRAVTHAPPGAPAGRRAVTPLADVPTGDFLSDRIALAGSGRFGYLLLADAAGAKVSVSIYDPRCDARP